MHTSVCDDSAVGRGDTAFGSRVCALLEVVVGNSVSGGRASVLAATPSLAEGAGSRSVSVFTGASFTIAVISRVARGCGSSHSIQS